MPNVTYEIVEAAIVGLQVRKRTIAAQIARLRKMRSNGHGASPAVKSSMSTQHLPKRRRARAAARKRMAKAQIRAARIRSAS